MSASIGGCRRAFEISFSTAPWCGVRLDRKTTAISLMVRAAKPGASGGGLVMGPELAVADGALGFWQAIEEVWAKTRG